MADNTRYVVRFWGWAGIGAAYDRDKEGQYVKTFDHEAFNGRGKVTFTPLLTEALVFESFDAATEFWKRQSKTVPLRPDGKPNRPMSAMNAELLPETLWPK